MMTEERLEKILAILESLMIDEPEYAPPLSPKVYEFVKAALPFLIANTPSCSLPVDIKPEECLQISANIELGACAEDKVAILQFGLNVHSVISENKIYLYEYINNFEPSKLLTDETSPEQFAKLFLAACQNPLNNIRFKGTSPNAPKIWYKDYPNKKEVEDHLKEQLTRLEMFKTLSGKQPSEKLYAFVAEALRYTVVNSQIKISLDEAEGWANFLQVKSSEIPSTIIFSYGLKVSVEIEEVNEKIECVFYEAKDRSNYEVKSDLTAEEFGKLLLKKCIDPVNN